MTVPIVSRSMSRNDRIKNNITNAVSAGQGRAPDIGYRIFLGCLVVTLYVKAEEKRRDQVVLLCDEDMRILSLSCSYRNNANLPGWIGTHFCRKPSVSPDGRGMNTRGRRSYFQIAVFWYQCLFAMLNFQVFNIIGSYVESRKTAHMTQLCLVCYPRNQGFSDEIAAIAYGVKICA
jgi:hypothetical protein